MFEKFDIDDKNIFKVCVVATMSSGKSTFINAILGEEIMPEKNEACTARTMAVLDNDSATVKKVHIIRRNGAKEVVEIKNRDVLEHVNNDPDIMDFLVETDIQSIANTSRALMLVDTPGVNNSEDERHGERTEEFLKQMDMGVIIYLLNATQLATNDDSLLLQLVCDHVKRQEGKVKVIFVINKIDALDLETESIVETVKIAKEYIQGHGITNPVIYPLSALAAKILRMALYRKEMSKREIRKLEDTYEHYCSRDNNMLAYAMIDDLAGEIYQIGENKITAQALQRAIENTGIMAIEKKLESFMNELERHYAPKIVIKSQLSESTAQKFQKKLDKISEFPVHCKWKRFEEVNARIKAEDALQKVDDKIRKFDIVSVKLDLSLEIAAASSDLNDFINNIENTKNIIFDIFDKEKYLLAKRAEGIYFCPERDEKFYISVKSFYYMSENGSQWSTVQFEHMVKLLDENREFYLYNRYASFVFKATKENNSDIIALLDTKIPVRTVRIAGQYAEQLSLDDVELYINKIVAEEKNKRQEIQNAEEQLKRTYKGITFATEKEKNDVVEIEMELQDYFKTLLDRSYEELWNKKEEISKQPSMIFAPYLTKFISALSMQENKEKNTYLEKIEAAGIDDLSELYNAVQNHHYTESIKNVLDIAIEKRRMQCQQFILEDMVRNIEDCDRKALKNIIADINVKRFDKKLTDEYVNRVKKQYDVLEGREMRELCAEIEEKNLQELETLEKRIREGGYQDQFTAQYFDMIHARQETLHIKNLEDYCSSVAAAEREELGEIREKVDKEECRSDLKGRFYELIQQREETLDYEELCALTERSGDKSLNELEELYRQLKTGFYNEKFIKKFILEVRINLELAQKRYIENLISDLQNMNKEQIREVVCQIDKCAYADRIVRIAKGKIAERLYVLDMYDLMRLNNDFDSLSLNDIQILRNQIKQKDVCERSKATYLKKLKDREMVIAFQNVSQIACFAKQTIMQYGISGVNIKLATFASDYFVYLEKYFLDGGSQDFQNIPILFFPECASLAISKTDIYYKINSKYTKVSLSDVRAFCIEKKLFTEALSITFNNGNSVTLSGGINKKNSQAVVRFLTTLVQNIGNETVLGNYEVYAETVSGLREEDFEMFSVPNAITEQNIVDIFLTKYQQLSTGIKNTAIKYSYQDNWVSAEAKVRKGFGITDESQIVWYYDRTLFNSAKEGMAFGCRFIHIKNNSQDLISIPYMEIYDISENSNQIVITTVNNNVFLVDFEVRPKEQMSEIALLFNEYVKGIQLICFGNGGSIGQIGNIERRCTNCNTIFKAGAKFCAYCGTKVTGWEIPDVKEYIFCPMCGNKIMKGKNFCSQCGTKIE